jgi:integrase
VFGNAVGECLQSADAGLDPAGCVCAEILGAELRDLRREVGSRLLERGMPEHYGQPFLDHATLSTTLRYLKTTQRRMREAVRRVEERRNRCTTGRSCATVDRQPH